MSPIQGIDTRVAKSYTLAILWGEKDMSPIQGIDTQVYLAHLQKRCYRRNEVSPTQGIDAFSQIRLPDNMCLLTFIINTAMETC